MAQAKWKINRNTPSQKYDVTQCLDALWVSDSKYLYCLTTKADSQSEKMYNVAII